MITLTLPLFLNAIVYYLHPSWPVTLRKKLVGTEMLIDSSFLDGVGGVHLSYIVLEERFERFDVEIGTDKNLKFHLSSKFRGRNT